MLWMTNRMSSRRKVEVMVAPEPSGGQRDGPAHARDTRPWRGSKDARVVVDADVLDAVDLEPDALDVSHHERERHRGVGAREDVFAHEEAPDQILDVEAECALLGAKAGDLQEEGPVVLKQAVDLPHEPPEVLDADVLRYLEAGDPVVDLAGDVAVVDREDPGALADAHLGDLLLAIGRSLLRDGDAGRVHAVLLGSGRDQRSPPAADVEVALALAELEFLTDQPHLLVLRLHQRRDLHRPAPRALHFRAEPRPRFVGGCPGIIRCAPALREAAVCDETQRALGIGSGEEDRERDTF